jgi:hypothetical protein
LKITKESDARRKIESIAWRVNIITTRSKFYSQKTSIDGT